MNRSLRVILPVIPNQRWSCHSCGDCCRALVGHLFEHERLRIQQQNWIQELGIEPVVRIGRQWVLNKRADGACVFLDDQNRCRIHSRYGEEAKPLACRIFPFSIRPVKDGWQATLRFDCPSVLQSKGASISQYRSLLDTLAATLPHADSSDRPARLPGGLQTTQEEIALLLSRLERWIADGTRPLMMRLIVAARMTAMLAQAKLGKVRGRRFGELIDVLLEGLAKDYVAKPAEPTPRQVALLRQLVFAHSEHVGIETMRAGVAVRIRKRLSQLRQAQRFLRGRGTVPPLAPAAPEVSFEQVEATRACAENAEAVDLVVRYLRARIDGRSVFGAGYYGWPVVPGINALWLQMVALGWLARYHAAIRGADSVAPEDLAAAVCRLDSGVTRLPALGTRSERARNAYLMMEDGTARLLGRFELVG